MPGETNFLIRIRYTQHQTWQGTIQWLDDNRTTSFRSMLEMIYLMEDALDLQKDLEWEHQFRNWKGKEGMG